VFAKRAVLAAAILATLPAASGAQDDIPTRMWGPVLGLTRTTMGGAEGKSAGYATRSGFVVGVQTQRDLGNGARFFRSGLVVTRRGGRQDDTSGNWLRLNLTYLEVPVLLGFNVFRGPRAKWQVLGGLQGGLRLGCSFDFNTGTKTSFDCDDPAIAFETKRFDFAAVAGGGVSFTRPRGAFTINATYAWGFSTIDASSSPGEQLNRGASFSFGWLGPMRRP